MSYVTGNAILTVWGIFHGHFSSSIVCCQCKRVAKAICSSSSSSSSSSPSRNSREIIIHLNGSSQPRVFIFHRIVLYLEYSWLKWPWPVTLTLKWPWIPCWPLWSWPYSDLKVKIRDLYSSKVKVRGVNMTFDCDLQVLMWWPWPQNDLKIRVTTLHSYTWLLWS